MYASNQLFHSGDCGRDKRACLKKPFEKSTFRKLSVLDSRKKFGFPISNNLALDGDPFRKGKWGDQVKAKATWKKPWRSNPEFYWVSKATSQVLK